MKLPGKDQFKKELEKVKLPGKEQIKNELEKIKLPDREQIKQKLKNFKIKNKQDEYAKQIAVDLEKLTDEEKLAYYGLMFRAAAEDGQMSATELSEIFNLINENDPEFQKKIAEFIANPPEYDYCVATLDKSKSLLRYSVLYSVARIVLADMVITPEEQQVLDKIAQDFNVNQEQKNALIDFARKEIEVENGKYSQSQAKEIMKNAAGALTGVGVPLASIYYAGSMVGFSGAGITSGLAALGLGMGMVSGIGVAIVMGTGIYVGTKKLIDTKLDKTGKISEKVREQKIQMAFRNMQNALKMTIDQNLELNKTADNLHQQLNSLEERVTKLYQKTLKKQGGEDEQ